MKVSITEPGADDGRDWSLRVRAHLFDHILPFWCGPAVDHEHGGWMAWLANDLTPDRAQPKGLIVHSRILWTFSAVHQLRPEALYRRMAERAYDCVMSKFWDAQHGGAFWQLDDRGKVLDDSKKIYGQVFCIYALTEFHRAFHSAPALARAQELFTLIERHGHDAKFGGYVEVCRRDWSPAGPEARLSDKDPSEKKSMNNHLHVLEAYTNLHRAAPAPLLQARLHELIQLFLQRILDSHTGHLHHFFDEAWHVRSATYTFGHDIEASWLLCEAAEALGDTAVRAAIRRAALRLAAVTRDEGLAANGGWYYEGKAGQIIDRGREWWPQAEAVVGFVNAYQISRDPKYFEAAQRVWQYIEQNVVDRAHGEWFWRINPDGRPDPKRPKVSEWKCPYHNGRACLEIWRRLGH